MATLWFFAIEAEAINANGVNAYSDSVTIGIWTNG